MTTWTCLEFYTLSNVLEANLLHYLPLGTFMEEKEISSTIIMIGLNMFIYYDNFSLK